MFNYTDKIYIKIENHWFDLTDYKEHPGGIKILKKYHLKDATKEFNNIKGHTDILVDNLLNKYEIKNDLLITFLNLIKSN
jgi:cytochrome b involved in lipid metabolism